MTAPNTIVLADTIRNIYRQNPENATGAIDAYLSRELIGSSVEEKYRVAEKLAVHFTRSEPLKRPSSSFADEQFLRFCSLLLGYPVRESDFTDGNVQQRLTEALTTIFETLNQLIRTINLTLLEDGQTRETIRALIGEQLEGSRDAASLKEHLDQIRTAFVSSHSAFKTAMQITVEKILSELDPEAELKNDEAGFNFNPLRKVDAYKRYRQTFKECRNWFESGRCLEEFLRTFEKQCAAAAKIPKEVLP